VFVIAIVLAAALVSVVVAFGDRDSRSSFHAAIEANDFEAWKTAVIASLTEEKFQKLVEKFNSKSDWQGDYEKHKNFSSHYKRFNKNMTHEDFGIIKHRWKKGYQ